MTFYTKSILNILLVMEDRTLEYEESDVPMLKEIGQILAVLILFALFFYLTNEIDEYLKIKFPPKSKHHKSIDNIGCSLTFILFLIFGTLLLFVLAS
jgi:hypothetical protein